MKLNKYLLIIALISVVNVGFAGVGYYCTTEHIEKLAVSDAELNAAYCSASADLVQYVYNLQKAEYHYKKCIDGHQSIPAICESLVKKYLEIYKDVSVEKRYSDIVSEVRRRRLEKEEEFIGYGYNKGNENLENGMADLYRIEKNLKNVSEQELSEKFKKINAKLQNNYSDRIDTKLSAIKRELEARGNAAK